MMAPDVSVDIRSFLSSIFAKFEPDYVITVERKGTALLRAALSGDLRKEIGLSWDRVLSSEALESLPPDFFEGRSILLLDDGIHIGRRIRRATEDLMTSHRVRREDIRVAAFGVHESATVDVDYRFFGQLTDTKYRQIRSLVIQQFQQEGSLLLDTEHIEVIAELNCGRLEFYDALSKAGVAVEHVSMGGRSNLMVHSPTLLDEREFLSSLPPQTSIHGVVRKIRVVERADGSYAIVPIFYPSTPNFASASDASGIEPCLSAMATTPSSIFHLVGIHASLELFKSATAALRDLIRAGKINIRIPRPDDHDNESLSHLRALFPQLDVNALHVALERNVEAGRNWKRNFVSSPIRLDATRGMAACFEKDRLAWSVLAELKDVTSHSLLPSQLEGEGATILRRGGATLADLCSRLLATETTPARGPKARTRRRLVGSPPVSRNLRDEALLSAALDELIDNASIVTSVAALDFTDNVSRLARLFRLDGEVVYGDVNKATATWRGRTPPPELTRGDV